MYHVPSTEELRKQSGVPFGLVISPLARIEEGENEPPISDFGPAGPVRCMRCKGNYNLSATISVQVSMTNQEPLPQNFMILV
jgi:hypothetical protein